MQESEVGLYFSSDEEGPVSELTELPSKKMNYEEATSEFPFEFTQLTNPLGASEFSDAFVMSDAAVEKNMLRELDAFDGNNIQTPPQPVVSKHSFTRVPEGRFKTAKSESGQMLYIPLKNQKNPDLTRHLKKTVNLLGKSVHTMLSELEISKMTILEHQGTQQMRAQTCMNNRYY